MQLLMDVIVNVLKNNLKMKMKLLKVIVIVKIQKNENYKRKLLHKFFS